MGIVGKYHNKYQSTPIYITLPHFGALKGYPMHRILAAMTLEVILCQSFCECVSNLVLGVDEEDLDKPLLHVFSKNDDSKHLCAWFLDVALEALQVTGLLCCLQILCSRHKVCHKRLEVLFLHFL